MKDRCEEGGSGVPEQNRSVFSGHLLLIVVTGVGLALITFILGFRSLAGGILLGTAVGALNFQMAQVGIRQLRQGAGLAGIQGRYMLRLLFSLLVLVFSSRMGVEFVLGALTGLLLEMLTNLGAAFRWMFVGKG